MDKAQWSIYASLAAAYNRARESEEWRLLYERTRELAMLVNLVKNSSRILGGEHVRAIEYKIAKISEYVYKAIKSGDIGAAAGWVSDAIEEFKAVYYRVRVVSFMLNSSRIVVSTALILASLVSLQEVESLVVILALFLIIGIALDAILLYKTMYPPYMLIIAGIIAIAASLDLISIGIAAPGLILAGGLGVSSLLIERAISSSFLR